MMIEEVIVRPSKVIVRPSSFGWTVFWWSGDGVCMKTFATKMQADEFAAPEIAEVRDA